VGAAQVAPARRSSFSTLLVSKPRAFLPPAVVLAAVVAGWQLVTTLGHIDPTVLPGPRLVVTSTWDQRRDLSPAVTTTTEEAVVGLLLALVIAFAVGVAIDGWRTVRRSLYPLVVASQTLPIIALAPLVVIWFGFGLDPKIVLVALFSFFPITVGLVQGLGSVDADTVALARTMRATRWQLLTRIKLPAALPQVFTGVRISVTYAFTSAIVAEFVGATQGLGVFMDDARGSAPTETDLVFGATVVVAILTIALFVLVGVVQRLAMPWRPPGGT
jgi:ABC-type nitrate/sulfonate/bicarbonate transport system permease component